MGFVAAVGASYSNILNFSGRASRAEYWWFVLYQFLAMFALTLGMIFYFSTMDPLAAQALVARFTGVSMIVFAVFFWLPALSSIVRRLHDSDRSGWWYFIVLVPFIGPFILLYFMLVPSSPGTNRFGHHPYGAKGKARVRLPRGMKPAPSEAERRAEILEYYRKNVVQRQG